MAYDYAFNKKFQIGMAPEMMTEGYRLKTVVNENSAIYYQGIYWNSFPIVLEYMSENFTGDKHVWWTEDFKRRFGGKPFRHALSLNCGNGLMEREFIDKNIVTKITAFDYSEDLLAIAEKEKGSRNIQYFQADVNKLELPNNEFDLIINVAALHHVQYLNRLLHLLCKAITEDGIFVNFDYIGPQRNQYGFKHWQILRKLNATLPETIRKEPLFKLSLPITDPTEAIHSELIIPYMSIYFDIFERHDTGGGIAYELLTNNNKLNLDFLNNLNNHITTILLQDKFYTESGQVPVLFSYFIAKPKKSMLDNHEKIECLQVEECIRELKAANRYWTYNQTDYIMMILYYKFRFLRPILTAAYNLLIKIVR